MQTDGTYRFVDFMLQGGRSEVSIQILYLLLMPSNVSLQEENKGADGRIVLAFRGTQLDSSQSSAADLCADVLLWDAGAALPANCAVFDNSTLDYFSQAVHYTQQVTLP